MRRRQAIKLCKLHTNIDANMNTYRHAHHTHICKQYTDTNEDVHVDMHYHIIMVAICNAQNSLYCKTNNLDVHFCVNLWNGHS